MTFWTDDINTDEVRSPSDIMADAGEELESRTGKLTVSIVESQLEDRVVFAFEVMQLESRATRNLFEASHRLDQSYPAVISPPAPDIPEFLKKERYIPGQPRDSAVSVAANFRRMVEGTPGRFVENEWVCVTPVEFKDKLTELFSKDYVKVQIISLLATTRSEEDSASEIRDTSEGSTEKED